MPDVIAMHTSDTGHAGNSYSFMPALSILHVGAHESRTFCRCLYMKAFDDRTISGRIVVSLAY